MEQCCGLRRVRDSITLLERMLVCRTWCLGLFLSSPQHRSSPDITTRNDSFGSTHGYECARVFMTEDVGFHWPKVTSPAFPTSLNALTEFFLSVQFSQSQFVLYVMATLTIQKGMPPFSFQMSLYFPEIWPLARALRNKLGPPALCGWKPDYCLVSLYSLTVLPRRWKEVI